MVPIPRILMVELACALFVLWKVMLGVTAAMVEMLSMCLAASSSPEITVTATGVACKLSERRCAVTVISAILPSSDAAVAAAAAAFPATWPHAGGETRPADESAATTPRTHGDVPKFDAPRPRPLPPHPSFHLPTP